MRRIHRTTPHAAQRGAATLVVVMVLFFIAALVSAYTSRNLIFEQRTSANQYRATQAFEAAEAGIEWALAMLNGGRIGAACKPLVLPDTPNAPDTNSFRQRYLTIDKVTGLATARLRTTGEPLRPGCVFDGTGWQCNCPADAAPALDPPVGSGPFPAFVVRFYDDPGYPAGVVRIESTGCTRLDDTEVCAAAATSGDGRARVTILAALKSAIVTPAAAVTVRGNLNLQAFSALKAVNSDPASSGLTLHVGGDIPPYPMPELELESLPGTPPGQSFLEQDKAMPDMTTAAADRMFTAAFGMGRDTYRWQPATVFIDCALDCSAAAVRGMARLNPGRVLWVDGNFAIDITDPIGTEDKPVVLVVTGGISITDPNARLNGVVYAVGEAWANSGVMTLNGALIGEANLTLSGGGTTTVHYDAGVLNVLRKTHGSFVRVPGSWKDF